MVNVNHSYRSPAASQLTLQHPSIGRSPAGFLRVSVELPPPAVGRLVGYDPRTLLVKPRVKRTGAPVPANVSPHVVALQNRVQRSIDTGRVAHMVTYLRDALTHGSFADWGPIELVTSAQPDLSNLETAHEIAFDTSASYFIADGQHRYCALLDLGREHPELARAGWTQSVTISIMPADRIDEWAGQSFHDRNYFAQPVRAGKALAVDSRDPVNALARDLDTHPVVKRAGGVAYERDTLLANDPRFTTHTVIHRFVRGFLLGRPGLDGKGEVVDGIESEAVERLKHYVTALGEVMPWFGEGREEYLARSSVVFNALAVLGHDLWHAGLTPAEIGTRIARLAGQDWRRTNLMWVGILGSEKEGKVQPASSRPAIDGLIRHLRRELGIGT